MVTRLYLAVLFVLCGVWSGARSVDCANGYEGRHEKSGGRRVCDWGWEDNRYVKGRGSSRDALSVPGRTGDAAEVILKVEGAAKRC